MKPRRSPDGYWTSQASLILVATGACISLGNFWRLPYLIDLYGSGAFILVYLLALIFMGIPLMIAEMLLGRMMRRNPVTGTRLVLLEQGSKDFWRIIGYLSLLAPVMVLSYYSVIAGWCGGYFFRSLAGVFSGMSVEESRQILYDVSGDPERSLAWHTIFMAGVCVFVAYGRLGLERVNRYLVPLSFVALLTLMLYLISLRLPVDSVVSGMFVADFRMLGWKGFMEALRHAFFTLSLGVGVMLALGVYTPNRTSLIKVSLYVVLLDLMFSFLAVILILTLTRDLPAPLQGSQLIFVHLPAYVGSLDGGGLALGLFYSTVLIVTTTTAIALMQPVCMWVSETFSLNPITGAAATTLVIWFLGLGTLLSFNILSSVGIYNRTVFGWLSLLTANILLPALALLICVFMTRVMHKARLREIWGEQGWYRTWRWCLRYPCRISLILVLIYSTGILDLAMDFWLLNE